MSAPTRQLWRLCGAEAEAGGFEPVALAEGLHLHASHAALDCVLMRIGTVQQSFVAMTGCSGCARGRCEPGCRVEMFRRMLERRTQGLSLQPVTGGLSTRPYTRAVLATPGRKAQVLDALLQPWPEARLLVSWRPGRRQHFRAVALLIVGVEGPSPGKRLREHGWQPWPVPTALGLRWACAPVPPVLPLSRVCRGEPSLLLPAVPTTSPPVVPRNDRTLDEPLTVWLKSLLAQPHQPAEEAPKPSQDDTPSPWPAGPGTLAPTTLGTLVAQLIAEPSFQSERKGQSGLSKGRLVKHAGLSENGARALMVWFDRAGVLAPPEDGQSPWRAPRPFALTDLEQIAAKLRDTPLPTGEEIRAAYGGEV